MLEAVRFLTTIVLDRSVTLHVDYRNLGVEELGTVYESLLDYTLAIAERAEASGSRVIEAGRVYLASLTSERCRSWLLLHAHRRWCSLVLDQALDPLLEERLAEAGPEADARTKSAILDLRVIDPACGSGAFLVGAIDRLALALASARSAPAYPADAAIAVARRDVLARCIYGVDKDPFAIELAKVALWIHCAVPDTPLSFLDAHLVCRDTLTGWPLLEVPDHLQTEAFEAKVALEDKKLLRGCKEREHRRARLTGHTPRRDGGDPRRFTSSCLPSLLADSSTTLPTSAPRPRPMPITSARRPTDGSRPRLTFGPPPSSGPPPTDRSRPPGHIAGHSMATSRSTWPRRQVGF